MSLLARLEQMGLFNMEFRNSSSYFDTMELRPIFCSLVFWFLGISSVSDNDITSSSAIDCTNRTDFSHYITDHPPQSAHLSEIIMSGMQDLFKAIMESTSPTELRANHLNLIRWFRENSKFDNDSRLLDLEGRFNATFEQFHAKFVTEPAPSPGNPLTAIFLPLWVIIVIIGFFSNIVVLIVLIRNENKLVYEIFCIGLAITDLTFLTTGASVTLLFYLFNHWVFGMFMCRIVNYIVYVSLYSSSMMILGLTASRFMAVVHPWENRKMKLFEAKLFCLGAWIIGLIFSIPVPIYREVKPNSDGAMTNNTEDVKMICIDDFPSDLARSAYQIFTTMMTYVIPFITIIVMNSLIVHKLRSESQSVVGSRQKNAREEKMKRVRAKVTQLVIIVSTLYCVCWLPTQFFNTWFNAFRHTFWYADPILFLKVIGQTLSFFSCCINPIVYSVISGSFKEAMTKQFPGIARAFQKSRRSSIQTEHKTMHTTTYLEDKTLPRESLLQHNKKECPNQTRNRHSQNESDNFIHEDVENCVNHIREEPENHLCEENSLLQCKEYLELSSNGADSTTICHQSHERISNETVALVNSDQLPSSNEINPPWKKSNEQSANTSKLMVRSLAFNSAAPPLNRDLSNSSYSWSLEGKQESIEMNSEVGIVSTV